jgi:hypothetical protein
MLLTAKIKANHSQPTTFNFRLLDSPCKSAPINLVVPHNGHEDAVNKAMGHKLILGRWYSIATYANER